MCPPQGTQIRMSTLRFLAIGLVMGALAYHDGLNSRLDSTNLTDDYNGLVNPAAYNVTFLLLHLSVAVFGFVSELEAPPPLLCHKVWPLRFQACMPIRACSRCVSQLQLPQVLF